MNLEQKKIYCLLLLNQYLELVADKNYAYLEISVRLVALEGREGPRQIFFNGDHSKTTSLTEISMFFFATDSTYNWKSDKPQIFVPLF